MCHSEQLNKWQNKILQTELENFSNHISNNKTLKVLDENKQLNHSSDIIDILALWVNKMQCVGLGKCKADIETHVCVLVSKIVTESIMQWIFDPVNNMQCLPEVKGHCE